jgi:hypothetical protein
VELARGSYETQVAIVERSIGLGRAVVYIQVVEDVSEHIVVESDPELGWKAKKGRGYETAAVRHVSRAL